MRKMILYIDMDNVLVDFQSALDTLDERTRKEYEGRFDEIPGIFSKMLPMPDAIDCYKVLCRSYDVYILSTAPWNNPSAWSDKLEWVKTHLKLEAHKRLILTHHKNLNIGDYLVDDRTNNGADKFKGELILFGSDCYHDWKAVTEYLLQKNMPD